MATFTEHYDLIKPGTDDYYDVADFNENMDAIDTQLYQAEQDMAGVSEKIGNPGDEGEDTLFGLLHPNNQPKETADFYHYSKTDIKKQIQDWTIQADSGMVYTKITTIRMEKNGTIYIKLHMKAKSTIEFCVFDKVISSVFDAPDKTTYGNNMPSDLNPADFPWFNCPMGFGSSASTKTYEWIIPVIAGVDYTFFLYGGPGMNITVTDFSIGYTDTKEA